MDQPLLFSSRRTTSYCEPTFVFGLFLACHFLFLSALSMPLFYHQRMGVLTIYVTLEGKHIIYQTGGIELPASNKKTKPVLSHATMELLETFQNHYSF
jgi:hypothetical protein